MDRSRTVWTVTAACAVITTTACGPSNGTGTTTADGTGGSITVFAAASLQDPFTELAEQFEAEYPGTTVALSFAGSSDLATQITAGAPADVFASADAVTMERLAGEGLLADEPAEFAQNTLTIAVPAGNPAGITGFSDLADPDTNVVLCAPQVPCGAAAQTAQESTGVDIAPVSEETSVTGVLGKVRSGQADAGLVYVTDVLAAGDQVEGIPFEASSDAVNSYQIAAVSDGEEALANAFIDLVTQEEGREMLADAGFGLP